MPVPTTFPVNPPGIPGSSPPNHSTPPRWMAVTRGLAIWLIVIPLVHGVAPWAISTLTRRYGWVAGSPGIWNWIGLIPVIVSITLLIWIYGPKWWSASGHSAGGVLAPGIAHTPERTKLTPSLLVVRGPYRFTRNPIYIAYLGLWLAWVLFYGSIGVLITWLLLCLVAKLILVPKEERDLEAAFGEVYLQYKNRVPRWFGKARC
jgi:protein-S-isoprenylcysteine O-methyltransferase Ste14